MDDDSSWDHFTVVVTEAIGLGGTTSAVPAERRKLLIAYRHKLDRARVEQEARLQKLTEARRRVDEELEAFERQELARRQVEHIRARVGERAPAPPPTKLASPVGLAARSPRFAIKAVVRFGEPPNHVYMRVLNISMTGALLATEPGLVERYPVGTAHEVSVFVSAEPNTAVVLNAKIARHDASAVAIDWSNDAEAALRVALLISNLEPQ